jgi:hypothetical protein
MGGIGEMPKNFTKQIAIGYLDPEYGDLYCLKHGQSRGILEITVQDNEFGRCAVCGEIIDDPDKFEQYS